MDRRTFLKAAAVCTGGALPLLGSPVAEAASDLEITRVRVFNPTDKTDLSGWLNLARLNQIAEFTERGPASLYQGESLQRPDGSYLYL
jgi:hypothetical protein